MENLFCLLQTSPDGNVTLSILNYVPTIRDAGKYMACRAENSELPDATLEDGWKLEIYCKGRFLIKKVLFKKTSTKIWIYFCFSTKGGFPIEIKTEIGYLMMAAFIC